MLLQKATPQEYSKNWLKYNAAVNKVSGADYKGFWSLEIAEQFLSTWADFDQSYLDSLCKDSSSAESFPGAVRSSLIEV